MIEKTDIIGKTFGYLKFIRKNFVKNGKTYYLCQCECGNMIDARRDSLIRGATKCENKNDIIGRWYLNGGKRLYKPPMLMYPRG